MRKLVIISGPTAVGKSDISIKLAKRIGGEIISADSVAVYRGLDIGSAKLSADEMQGIKHYLIDCLEPTDDFDVSVFQKLANEAVDEIYSHGKIPIMVGGTAFYIQALIYGIDFTGEDHDDSYRKSLEEFSPEQLYAMLTDVDPDYAQSVHMNNKKRVIRALEYNHFTGDLFSRYNKEQSEKTPLFDFNYFVLDDNRERLYERIDKRVDKMIQMGLVEEVRGLKAGGYTTDMVSMQGIGYKEIFSYLNGECSLSQAIEDIKLGTRHFAKRQLTWFRHEKDTQFINKGDFNYDDDRIVEYMIDKIGVADERNI